MTLQRIKLANFKRFPAIEIPLNSDINVLVGDNESGKSTILMALDLVLGGSRTKVETIGLESLLNKDAVSRFLLSGKKIEDLPILSVEVYLTEQNDPNLNGRNNSDRRDCDGLKLTCQPIWDLSEEIQAILQQDGSNFPFEYYEVKFVTFSGTPYAGYNRPVMHLLIDSAQISNEYATREYVRDLYSSSVAGTERNKHQNEYRRHKEAFRENVLGELNQRLDKYSFVLKTTGKATLESDLTIADQGITIENKGTGQQSFIKTEFALMKSGRNKRGIDVLLLEEPENHLSHVNMKRLISKIRQRSDKQIIIATHSNLISARLDLRKCILFNSNSARAAFLGSLSEDTAEFFMKAPDNNILEFILSRKVILVEGDAEFILAQAFFETEVGQPPEDSDTHVISVGGTSFKRYLEVARLLGIKTAVVRDNDGDYRKHCVERYAEYVNEHIKVFAERDGNKPTFEICLYEENKAICDELFIEARKTLSVTEYMLKNKAEAAFELLRRKGNELRTPQYIRDAIAWIRQ